MAFEVDSLQLGRGLSRVTIVPELTGSWATGL